MNEPETLTLNMHSYSTVHFKCVEKAVLNARQFMSVVDCAEIIRRKSRIYCTLTTKQTRNVVTWHTDGRTPNVELFTR